MNCHICKNKTLNKSRRCVPCNKEYMKKYYNKNKKLLILKAKKWSRNNVEKRKQICKTYYSKNSSKICENSMAWAKINIEKTRKQAREYQRRKLKTIHGSINNRMSCSMRYALRFSKNPNKCGKSWKTIVGYSVKELEMHLAKSLSKDMSWNDFLKGRIEIDHIRPISSFTFDSYADEDFKKCWALNNLTLRWKRYNRHKSDKLPNGIRACIAKKQKININHLYDKNN